MMFHPIVVTFSSKSSTFIQNNCVSQGKYCAFDPIASKDSTVVTGRDVIMEGLR